MPDTVQDIKEMRRMLRAAVGPDTRPETWLPLVHMDYEASLELLPIRELAPPGSPERRVLVRHIRFLAGKAIAAALEALDDLERLEGVGGPIGDDSLSTAEGARMVDQLVSAAHGEGS